VRTGDAAEHQNQHDEAAAGCDRVHEQRDGRVAAGQPVAHDGGADDDGQQQGGAESFGDEAARERHAGSLQSDRDTERRSGNGRESFMTMATAMAMMVRRRVGSSEDGNDTKIVPDPAAIG